VSELSKGLRIRKETEKDRDKKLYILLIILFIINAPIIAYLGYLLLPISISGIILWVFLFIFSIIEILTLYHYANKYSATRIRNRYIKRK